MMQRQLNLVKHDLGDDCRFFEGELPPELTWDQTRFDRIWQIHPEDKHNIMIHGRLVKTPRWQQAFEAVSTTRTVSTRDYRCRTN